MSATLIQRAVERGLVRLPAPRPPRTNKRHPELEGLPRRDYNRLWTRWYREQFRQQGLTVLGKPRLRPWVRRPKGLGRREYHRRYMQWWRAQ